MKTKGLTLMELLLCIAVLGIVGGAAVSNIPALFRTTRNSTQTVQTASVARAYMEHIRTKFSSTAWATSGNQTMTFSSLNTIVGSSATNNLTASLTVQARNLDSDTLTSAAACTSIVSSSCAPAATYTLTRWLFTLTVNVTDGATSPTVLSSQTYVMELGK